MNLERVSLIIGLIAACLAVPLAGEAQQQVGKLSRVGVLMNLYSPEADPPQALRKELRDLGYVEEKNFVIEFRGGLKPTPVEIPVALMPAIAYPCWLRN